MGYRKIANLYRPEISNEILSLKEVYATEKIHGTSAHVGWRRKAQGNAKPAGFFYFPGGIKPEAFKNMMAERFPALEKRILEAISYTKRKDINEVIFYGEAYGGKCQKMSHIYGSLNFIVFEVKVNDEWQNVPIASGWASLSSLPFVFYMRGPATVEWLDSQRDLPSVQAARNGFGSQIGEGIVIRALDESLCDNRGNRIIGKHKRPEFRETKSVREVDPEKQRIWREARETAEEFVVLERLNHVLDKLVATKPGFEYSFKNMRCVIGAMMKDVRKEEGKDIEWSNAIQKAIGAQTAKLFKEYLNNRMKEAENV